MVTPEKKGSMIRTLIEPKPLKLLVYVQDSMFLLLAYKFSGLLIDSDLLR